MKKIYFILFPLLIITSCKEDWVDTKPYGSPSTAFFYQNSSDVTQAVAAMYQAFRNESTWGRNLFWVQNGSDDFVIGRSNADAANIKNFIPTGRESYMTGPYNDLNGQLNRANQVLANIDKAVNISEELRARSKGEAYFIRAFAHFWLAYIWGRDDQGVPFDGPENAEFQKRIPPQLPSVKDNYAQIISDLKKAAKLLPYFESYTSADYGRAHIVAAWAYMVKVYAYWAQFDNTKWALIPSLCDSIKTYGNRALLPNFGNVFKVANNWGSEYIWSVNSGILGGSEFPGVVLENTGWGLYNGWGYFNPTEELYEEFEATDPRRELTIFKYGDTFTYFGSSRRYYSTNSLTGFQLAKYMEPYSYGTSSATNTYINQNGNAPTTKLNVPLIRYSEILLFKAEALLMQNKPLEAAVPLNEVRKRVGLASIASPTMADVKHERRCELAGEFTDRCHDLIRWGDYDKLQMALHGRSHTTKTNPDSPYTITVAWPARTFNAAKNIAWPYNPDEISLANGAYNQNSGW